MVTRRMRELLDEVKGELSEVATKKWAWEVSPDDFVDEAMKIIKPKTRGVELRNPLSQEKELWMRSAPSSIEYRYGRSMVKVGVPPGGDWGELGSIGFDPKSFRVADVQIAVSEMQELLKEAERVQAELKKLFKKYGR